VDYVIAMMWLLDLITNERFDYVLSTFSTCNPVQWLQEMPRFKPRWQAIAHYSDRRYTLTLFARRYRSANGWKPLY
jgi:hypothetical protein